MPSHLRLEFRRRDLAPTGYHYTLKFGNWRGNRPGLFCWNVKTDKLEEAGYVDVDWSLYEPSGR